MIRTKGGWKHQVLYSFAGGSNDGADPIAGLTFDSAGNLYGTTASGGGPYGCGTVFKLVADSHGGWTETFYTVSPAIRTPVSSVGPRLRPPREFVWHGGWRHGHRGLCWSGGRAAASFSGLTANPRCNLDQNHDLQFCGRARRCGPHWSARPLC